jgi:WD40 repeat protein
MRELRSYLVKRLIFLCLALLTITPVQAKANTPDIPPEVMQLGRGTAITLDWHPDGSLLAVGGSLGVWLYDDNLADIGHVPDTGSLTSFAWSPDGNWLATFNEAGSLQIWSVDLEPLILSPFQAWRFTIEGYIDSSITWAPDSQRLAMSIGERIQVFDISIGKTIVTVPEAISPITWHPDGTKLAGVVDLGEAIGKEVRVWDATTGSVMDNYTGIDPYLFWSDIQWSPDGSRLVGLTSLPATVHVWSSETGDLLNDVNAYIDDSSIYFNMWWADDVQQLFIVSRYVSGPAVSMLSVWDTATWKPFDTGVSLGPVWKIAKHPGEAVWAGLTLDSQMMLWGLEQPEPQQVRIVHSQPPHILTWSSNSHYLAVASSTPESISIWDMTMLDQPHLQTATLLYLGWNLNKLRWGASDDTLIGFQSISETTAPGAYPIAVVMEWDTQKGAFAGIIHETPGYVAHDGSEDYLPYYLWNDDFTQVITEMRDQPLTISTTGGDSGPLSPSGVIATIDPVGEPFEIMWSPDSTMLAVTTRDPQGETSAWVYNAQTGDLVNRLRPSFFTTLYDMSWSPDSSMVAVAGRRGVAGSGETEYRLDVLKVDPSSDEATHIITILDADTTFYHTWHPDSLAIAVSTSSGIAIYAMEPAPIGVQAAPIVNIPDMEITALSWSPNGLWLAGGDEDGTTRIWNVRNIIQ